MATNSTGVSSRSSHSSSIFLVCAASQWSDQLCKAVFKTSLPICKQLWGCCTMWCSFLSSDNELVSGIALIELYGSWVKSEQTVFTSSTGICQAKTRPRSRWGCDFGCLTVFIDSLNCLPASFTAKRSLQLATTLSSIYLFTLALQTGLDHSASNETASLQSCQSFFCSEPTFWGHVSDICGTELSVSTQFPDSAKWLTRHLLLLVLWTRHTHFCLIWSASKSFPRYCWTPRHELQLHFQ